MVRHERHPIASLTKMMTAWVIAKRHKPGEKVLISRDAVRTGGSKVGVLPKGKRVELRALMEGLLLVSGNDAAVALAEHDAGSVERFAERMNEEARRLGQGQSVPDEGEPGEVALFDRTGRCLGLGRRGQGRLAPQRLFRWAANPQAT